MITCDECKTGISATISQMLSEEFVTIIVDTLSGEFFCDMEDDAELCASVIADLIPLALPVLAGSFEGGLQDMVCNMAIPDTCQV